VALGGNPVAVRGQRFAIAVPVAARVKRIAGVILLRRPGRVQRPSRGYDRKNQNAVRFVESSRKGKTRGRGRLRKMLQSGKVSGSPVFRDRITVTLPPA
jgi:hypothetical protein